MVNKWPTRGANGTCPPWHENPLQPLTCLSPTLIRVIQKPCWLLSPAHLLPGRPIQYLITFIHCWDTPWVPTVRPCPSEVVFQTRSTPGWSPSRHSNVISDGRSSITRHIDRHRLSNNRDLSHCRFPSLGESLSWLISYPLFHTLMFQLLPFRMNLGPRQIQGIRVCALNKSVTYPSSRLMMCPISHISHTWPYCFPQSVQTTQRNRVPCTPVVHFLLFKGRSPVQLKG